MRTTIKQLEYQMLVINEMTNSPITSYTRVDGKTNANIGNYHLYQAYGGVCVHRMTNLGGGVTTPIFNGCIPKKEAYYLISAFIKGLETAKQ